MPIRVARGLLKHLVDSSGSSPLLLEVRPADLAAAHRALRRALGRFDELGADGREPPPNYVSTPVDTPDGPLVVIDWADADRADWQRALDLVVAALTAEGVLDATLRPPAARGDEF